MSTGIFSITIESRQIALDTINTKSTIDTSVVYNKMEATKKNNEMSNKNSQSILIKIFSMHWSMASAILIHSHLFDETIYRFANVHSAER